MDTVTTNAVIAFLYETTNNLATLQVIDIITESERSSVKMIFSLVLIFIFGCIGYRIFSFLRIPGCAITGPLLTIAIITCQGFKWVELSTYLLTFLQIIVGIAIGSRLKKEQIPVIKNYLIPGIISSIWLLIVSLLIGFQLVKMTDIDIGTALYGSVPGGIFEMGLIALSLNLSVPIVTLLQFVRVISISLSVPMIVSRCNKNTIINKDNERISFKKNLKHNAKEKLRIYEILVVLLLGSIGGFTAKYMGVPVGGILGSMIVIGILRILGMPLKELPEWLVLITRITLGGYLGTTFVPEILSTFRSLIIPVIFFSVFITLNGIIIGYIFCKTLKWDLATSLLASSAGGVTLMTLTALELDADTVKVSIIQTLRVIIILLIMPILIQCIISN